MPTTRYTAPVMLRLTPEQKAAAEAAAEADDRSLQYWIRRLIDAELRKQRNGRPGHIRPDRPPA